MFGWWQRRSQAARFDLHARASFYLNFALAPLLVGLGLEPDLGPRAWLVVGLMLIPAGIDVWLVHAGFEAHLGRRPRPDRLISLAGLLTLTGVGLGWLIFPDATPGHVDGPATAILLVLSGSFVTALAAAVPTPVAGAAGVAGGVAVFGLSVAQGHPGPGAALAFGLVVGFLIVAMRTTLWMLALVWELDRARHVQADLAVAEERLRFARDLHDVVGHALSAVAVKAELAAQLAKRGRSDSIDEMLEVRRVAQDSLTELRAVVGGYRSADLDTELAGARSLLASAGVDCRVIGDGAGLPATVQSALGWAVREAATNVLRHSEARTCTIALRPEPGGVTLTVANDGVTGPVGTPGNGLTGLAERISALGGSVVSGAAAPAGYEMKIWLLT